MILCSVQTEDKKDYNIHSFRGLADACRFVCNDAKFVNERARNDIVLLSRYCAIVLWLVVILYSFYLKCASTIVH